VSVTYFDAVTTKIRGVGFGVGVGSGLVSGAATGSGDAVGSGVTDGIGVLRAGGDWVVVSAAVGVASGLFDPPFANTTTVMAATDRMPALPFAERRAQNPFADGAQPVDEGGGGGSGMLPLATAEDPP
jgi:hypothetical protein